MPTDHRSAYKFPSRVFLPRPDALQQRLVQDDTCQHRARPHDLDCLLDPNTTWRAFQVGELSKSCGIELANFPSSMGGRCQRRAAASGRQYLRSRPERLLSVLCHCRPPPPPRSDKESLVASIAWYGLWQLKMSLYGGVIRSGAAEIELGQDGDIDFQVESLCQEDFDGTGWFLACLLTEYAKTLDIVTDVSLKRCGPIIEVTIVCAALKESLAPLLVQLVNINHFHRSPDFTCNLLVAVPLISESDQLREVNSALHGIPAVARHSCSAVALHSYTSHLARCHGVELRLAPGAPAHYTVLRVISECRQLVFGSLKDLTHGTMPDRMDRFISRESHHPRSGTSLRWQFVPGLGRRPTYMGANALEPTATHYFT